MQATDSAVRREITVNATPERAFEVFTEQLRQLVAAQPHDRRGRAGEGRHRAAHRRALVRARRRRQHLRLGRGARLRAAAPARRSSGGSTATGPSRSDPDAFSEIEVTFTPEGDATRVTLEHRHLDRHTAAEALKEAVGSEGGWPGLLAAYAEAVSRRAETPSRRSSCSSAARPCRAGRPRTRGRGGHRRRWQTTSVRIIPCETSRLSSTASATFGSVKLGQPEPGLELGLGVEQLRAAAGTGVGAVGVVVDVLAGERPLGRRPCGAPGTARGSAPRATARRSSRQSSCPCSPGYPRSVTRAQACATRAARRGRRKHEEAAGAAADHAAPTLSRRRRAGPARARRRTSS